MSLEDLLAGRGRVVIVLLAYTAILFGSYTLLVGHLRWSTASAWAGALFITQVSAYPLLFADTTIRRRLGPVWGVVIWTITAAVSVLSGVAIARVASGLFDRWLQQP